MADTERTLAQLQSLFASTAKGEISAQDLRDFLVTALGGYGSIYVQGGSSPQGSLSATPAKLTAFTTDGPEDPNSNVNADAANDRLTVAVAGTYEAHLSASFAGTDSTTYVLGVAVDGTLDNSVKAEQKLATGADIEHIACSGPLALTAGQVITAAVAIIETPAAQTITVKHANLWLKRIG